MTLSTGPVILDLIGPEVTAEEREILQHPMVAGVILFARHYESPEQIAALVREIRAARKMPLLVTVDQEGGRVQRFIKGFTRLPAMGEIGECASADAMKLAECAGWMMASEVLSVGVDLSFAPVLDLNKGHNTVIGSRSFHHEPLQVVRLAKAFIRGMHEAGMRATGKHFPGHGDVRTDSHLELPVDDREFLQIEREDLIPFRELLSQSLDAIMPAHILFPKVDSHQVGFSAHWLQTILRKTLGFKGIIISDDLNMRGAGDSEDYAARARSALTAGCDFILICNNRKAAVEMLDHLPIMPVSPEKFKKLQGNFTLTMPELRRTKRWAESHAFLTDSLSKVKGNSV